MPTTVSVRVCLAALLLGPKLAHAQHIRRTDDVTQAALIQSGLSAETVCLSDMPRLGVPGRPYSLAGSLSGVLDGRRDTASRTWMGRGMVQLRAHGRNTGCHFDWRLRALGGTRARIGTDAVVVGTLPAVLGGAVHVFAEAGAASDARAAEEFDTPRHTEIGAAYTTFNLYRTLLPFAYSNFALDVRLRLSAGASMAYGEAERMRGKSSVPDLSATVVGKVEEFLHGGVLYTIHAIPDYGAGADLWEQTTTLMYGFRRDVPSGWLSARSPYVMLRHTAWHLGELRHGREVALSAGLTLF